MKREIKGMFTGLGVTFKTMMKPTVTVQYPHESLKMPTRFRGHIELVRDPETGKPKCFACKLCERACPSDCITVDGAKLEVGGSLEIALWPDRLSLALELDDRDTLHEGELSIAVAGRRSSVSRMTGPSPISTPLPSPPARRPAPPPGPAPGGG